MSDKRTASIRPGWKRSLDKAWLPACIILVSVIALELASILSPQAIANHRAATGWHLSKMHSSAADQEEDVCVQPGADTHVAGSDLRLNIRGKLYIDNTAQDWDELASNKIYFNLPFVNGSYQPCSGFPNRSSIPIEIYEAHDPSVKDARWFYGDPCGNIACTMNDGDVWNAIAGHYDKRDSYVFFPERTLYVNISSGGNHAWQNDSQRAYVISHEFGHVLGLADGTGDLCDKSIMHAGKSSCSTIKIFWPQQIDRDSVVRIANNN